MNLPNINKTSECKICNKTYSDPIIPEFGHNKICGKDLNEIKVVNKMNIKCKELEDSIKSIDLDGDFIKARQSIENLTAKIHELNILIKDPDHFLHEYFSNLRHKIDIEREEFKAQIDEHYLGLIEKVNNIESSLKPLNRSTNSIQQELTCFEKRIFYLNTELASCLEKDWEKVEFEAKFQQMKLEQIKNELKSELLEDTSYSFLNSYLNFGNIEQIQLKTINKAELPKTGNFEFKLCNFSKFSESVGGHKDKVFIFNKMRWILRYQNKDGKYLGIRLQFLPNKDTMESLKYAFSFRLINFENPSKTCEHRFKLKERSSGEFKGKDCSSFKEITESGFYDAENDSMRLVVQIELS